MQMQLFHAAGAADGINATGEAAAALKTRQRYRRIAGQGCGHRPVAPFAGETAIAVDEPAIDDQPAADTRPEDDAEDDTMALSGADFRFGYHETIGIV
ncbi:hypothetical protein D3C80_233740 [compost metagenome]